jgi:hypothetical protein
MRRKWLLVVVAALVGGTFYVGSVLATTPAAVTVPPGGQFKATFGPIDVMSNALPDTRWFARLKTMGESDVWVTTNNFDAHSTSGWHSHPGPSLVLVTQGTVTNYTAGDCSGTTYSAGQGFVDAGGSDVHMLTNRTDQPAQTVAVQVLAQGSTRKIPVSTPPPGCPAS